jgi:dUTP pyrophosphatase
MNVNVKEKLKTLSVSDSGIDSIMEIMDLPDKQFDAMFPELKKAIGEIYDDEIAVEKTLNDMRKLNVSRTQFMQEAEQLKTLINDIENDNALSKNKKELLTTVLYEAVKLTEMAIENPRERIVVKYVKVNENAKIPTYAHDSDAGADIYAAEDVEIKPHETVIIKTGLKVEIPEGYMINFVPRSGMSYKTPLRIPNAPAVIDSHFRGEMGVIMENTGNLTQKISAGDRIAQMLIMPVPMIYFKEVEELSETDRAEGGFGSTGVKS